jgi:hypothetical protein
MAFKLMMRNSVVVPLKGELKDDNGKPERFEFALVCRRMGADELRETLKDGQRTMKAVMLDVTEGWRNVLDADGQTPVPFATEPLDQLLDTPGLAQLAFEAYLKEQAAHAKN